MAIGGYRLCDTTCIVQFLGRYNAFPLHSIHLHPKTQTFKTPGPVGRLSVCNSQIGNARDCPTRTDKVVSARVSQAVVLSGVNAMRCAAVLTFCQLLHNVNIQHVREWKVINSNTIMRKGERLSFDINGCSSLHTFQEIGGLAEGRQKAWARALQLFSREWIGAPRDIKTCGEME